MYPGGDALSALGWGDEILAGNRPNFDVWAPAKHPLTIAVGAFASLFGPSTAITLLIAFSLASFGLLGYAAYRFARLLGGPLAGGVAALVLLTRPGVIELLATGQKDLPFAALTLLAATLFAEGPRRNWLRALVLLAIAGLIRPEAWLLSALLAAWVAIRGEPGRRVAAIALAASAPLGWALTDLALTGNPLHTFLERRTRGDGVRTDLIESGESVLVDPSPLDRFANAIEIGILRTLTVGVAIGGLLAFAIVAWQARRAPRGERWGSVHAPLGWVAAGAMLATGVGAVAAFSLLNTPVAGRFLLVPASVLVVAWAALIWVGGEQSTGPRLRALALAGLLAGVITLALAIPDNLDDINETTDESELFAGVYDGAVDLAAMDVVADEVARCDGLAIGPPDLLVAAARVQIAMELGVTMREIPVRQLDRAPPGAAVFRADGGAGPGPPGDAEPLAAFGGWSFYGCE